MKNKDFDMNGLIKKKSGDSKNAYQPFHFKNYFMLPVKTLYYEWHQRLSFLPHKILSREIENLYFGYNQISKWQNFPPKLIPTQL